MTRFISVADCDFGFRECMEARDFENASSYYESLKHHYKKRGLKIKLLRKKLQNRGIKDEIK
jgi:hypothetical protein